MRNSGWSQATTAEQSHASGGKKDSKIPQKQAPRGRLWLNDGSCHALAERTYPNHVWSYDFVFIRDAYGRKIRMLTMIDEFSTRDV
jgi:hypothetical protein